MADALEDHKSTVSIGGRAISKLRFADDIDGLAGSKLELANLVECLDKTSTAYQSINQSNFYSANIPGVARLSGATARSVFKC